MTQSGHRIPRKRANSIFFVPDRRHVAKKAIHQRNRLIAVFNSLKDWAKARGANRSTSGGFGVAVVAVRQRSAILSCDILKEGGELIRPTRMPERALALLYVVRYRVERSHDT